ncbi:hypothetical protein QNH98_08715 [Myroides sp. mNGS23_01]|nr:hypothetical protein [Myroides sp. mNGS23_01]WHT40610.1 hypothetical protein QNH98_08715 [Myroides sp. mNGS23_01]
MKKITLLAAVLGASYFANAQVGIGIPTPVSSTQLDVTAIDKGILIPRVSLTALNEFKPIVGTQTESLLVYNIDSSFIPTGFYYWVDAKWNRIVGKAELDQVIENLGDNITNLEADVKNIQTVINYILPSNPSNDDATPETHTTVVYKEGKFYTVTYDATTQTYTTQEINFEDLVNGFETKTFIKEVLNADGKVIGMIYFSEQTIIDWLAADAANTIGNIPNNAPGAMPIKVKDIVVNNIQEILESPTNITITTVEGDRTFTTVEEYLQYITQFSNGNVIYTQIADPDNAGQTIWVFQYWDEATNTYKTIDIQGLVEAAETNTTIVTYNNKQYYLSEAYIKAGGETDPANWTAVPAGAIHVDVVGGVINNIQEILESPTNLTINTIEGSRTFTTVEEYIQYISQYSDGNVVYREIDDPANAGQKIWVFQYWDDATNTYKTINIKDLVEAAETNTTIVVYNNKQYYLSEAYIKAGGETDPANWTAVPAGAIHIDVVGGVINNIQEILESPTNITITTTEGDKTFTTVEEYLQYISQYSDGNVVYREIDDPANAGQKIWVFQYWDEATNTYKTIDIQGLVEAAETNTTIVTYNNKQYYLSEAYIKAGGETDPANWTAVPAGAIHVDVVGGVINNIQEILESPTNITITTTEGDKTFTTVEEYLQYISQYSDGNVVYREIDDPANAGQKIWVFQYWDEATNTYKTIDIQGLVEAAETNTTIVTYNNKQYYLSEAYIKAGGETDPANWTAVPAGAIHVDVVGGVINNIQEILESPTNITITTTEGDKTFTTVEEYLQYISQYSDGNVVYREIDDPANAGQKIWVFQYWDEATNTYKTIDIQGLVEAAETNTTIVTYNNKQYYLSEAYIKAGGETDPANWTAVPAGAIHVDVVGGVINNIQEILESPTNITITTTEGDKTFTTVEEYIQYISQYSNGNVIYTQIADPDNAGQTIWVFQYWDEASNSYKTIDIKDLVAQTETKTQIKRTEVLVDGTLPTFGEVRTAPVAGDVKKGEIFYEYNAEGGNVDYINMTEDILNSINNNEEIKNAITNVLNLGGNVYFGDHDNDDNTPAVFYQVITKLDGTKENKEIELPASFLVNLINKYKDIVKQTLGDTIINEGDTVFTGNVYNGYKVYLGKGATTIQVYSAVAAPVSFNTLTGDKQIRQVLGIKLLNAAGHIVTESTTDVAVETGTTVKFNIGVGNQYMMLPAGNYEVVVEYASNEQVQP